MRSLLRRPGSRGESRVLQLAAQLVVAGEVGESLVKAEDVKHIRVGTEGHGRAPSLDSSERGAGHARALGHELHREPAAKSGEADVLAELPQRALHGRVLDGGRSRHDEQYSTRKVGRASLILFIAARGAVAEMNPGPPARPALASAHEAHESCA